MKTNELEKEIGLSKYTIRYYEKEGLIQPVESKVYENYIKSQVLGLNERCEIIQKVIKLNISEFSKSLDYKK